MTTIRPQEMFSEHEQPELWMPTGGNPALAYERALAAAVPGTGAQTVYRYSLTHEGLVYAFLLEVDVEGNHHVVVQYSGRSARAPRHHATATLTARPESPVSAPARRERPAEAEVLAITAAEQIDTIQDALSLGISHIAEILGVARGTVHSWARGDTPIPRDPAIARRLRDLHQVGMQWRAHSEQEIGRLLTAPLGDGEPSLYDLLRAATWERERLERALLLLSDRVEERRARPAREELIATPASAREVERRQLRSLVQRGRFYGR